MVVRTVLVDASPCRTWCKTAMSGLRHLSFFLFVPRFLAHPVWHIYDVFAQRGGAGLAAGPRE